MTSSEILSNYYLSEDSNLNEYLNSFLTNPSYFIPRLLNEKNQVKKAIYALSNISKKKVCSDVIHSYFDKDETLIDKFILSEDSKVRKNSYILIGNVKYFPFLELVKDRLYKEKTYYCLPSLILALGNLNCEVKFLKQFKTYFENLHDELLSDRQREDTLIALKKAIDKNMVNTASFEGYINASSILLTTLEQAKPFLLKELSRLNIEILKEVEEGYVIKYSRDFSSIRCYYDCYLYFSDLYMVSKDKLIDNLLNKLEPDYFARMFVMDKKLKYRISLITKDNVGVKKAFIQSLEKKILNSSRVFENSSSNYDFEIIIKQIKESYKVFISLSLDKDNRFNYRKNNLPASINPVTASIVANFASKYVNSSSVVCDPFCGSGTMLIELDKLVKVKKLIGVDIFVRAITFAKENAKLAGTNIDFITSDITECDSLCGVNLVISNMPFGNRVGSHSENEKLYSAFFDKCSQFLTNNATLALYTTEIELIKNCLFKRKQFSLIKQVKLTSGDMNPSLFIIKFKRK